jgi:hypothetical protein
MIKEECRGVQECRRDGRRQMINDRFSGEIKEECCSSSRV